MASDGALCPIMVFIATIYVIEILQYFPHLTGFLHFNIDGSFCSYCIILSFWWKFKTKASLNV